MEHQFHTRCWLAMINIRVDSIRLSTCVLSKMSRSGATTMHQVGLRQAVVRGLQPTVVVDEHVNVPGRSAGRSEK